jgi:hypothetical protein
MGSIRLTRLLVQALRMFIENKPNLMNGGSNAEGGGDDMPSARYALITLAQLSFLHDRDNLF